MSAGTADPIIREVREHMARAAELADEANTELRTAARRLRTHPDFTPSRRGGGPATFPWWLGECIASVLEDGPLGEAAAWIRDDLRGARSTLREFIRDENKTLTRRAV